jgi:hypothetical protein
LAAEGSPDRPAAEVRLAAAEGNPGGSIDGKVAVCFMELDGNDGATLGKEIRRGSPCCVMLFNEPGVSVGLILNSIVDLDWARAECNENDWLVTATQVEVSKASKLERFFCIPRRLLNPPIFQSPFEFAGDDDIPSPRAFISGNEVCRIEGICRL